MGIEENNLFSSISNAIFEHKKEKLINIVQQSIEEGINPLDIFKKMTLAIREVGKLFNNGELFLPDLIVASNTIQGAIPLIEAEIKKRGLKTEEKGIVVMGTVLGDVHCIGKNIVVALLRADGFRVIDLGVNVSHESFIDSVEKENADILGMSALLTTTMKEQERTIAKFNKKNLREKVRIMIGGAPITESFANDIGADGYASDAPGAVKLANKILNKGK